MNLINQYKKVRDYTEKLCEPLKPEDYVVQVAEFASPAKWQLGHTSWFFETFVLLPNLKNYKIFNREYPFLFNSYYNNAGKRILRTNRGNLTRPTIEEIYNYRKYVDEAMLNFLSKDLTLEISNLITIGLQHEQQHQELLLTDIKFMFGQNPLFPAYDLDTTLLNNEENKNSGSCKINEGIYTIGHQGNGFCYDNELNTHKVYLESFEIENALVTNGEYIEFIEAESYKNFNLWLDEGWEWINKNKIKAPLYWHKVDGKWMHYTLKGLEKIKPNNILKHISFYEAMAYAEWKNMRLPTEFEWEAASDELNWGQRWEWTNSAYLPYPGFKKAPGAIGEYNGKFMINQMVLRGSSIATSPNHSRKTYRNFFHPTSQWQFTGIRLVK